MNNERCGRKLVAAIACRNQGERLYGKPLQNLDVERRVRIIDNVISCLETISSIDEIVLGVSEGIENEIYQEIAQRKNIRHVLGDPIDVLSRLVKCGEVSAATDIFRVTSESPFPLYDYVDRVWQRHVSESSDASFFDEAVDGCGFEIISLEALRDSHLNGEQRHRSELCTLYIRENFYKYKIVKADVPKNLIRKDLRLTVDNPEDLALCRVVFDVFRDRAPRIPVNEVIMFLDKNPELIKLTSKYTEIGYATMYKWGHHEE